MITGSCIVACVHISSMQVLQISW